MYQGDNLKQEQFALQLLEQIQQIFYRENVNLNLYIYSVLTMNHQAGIIEFIANAMTIDNLKKKLEAQKIEPTLLGFFNYFFQEQKQLSRAKKNFCRSLAAYSLTCYILQIKDRHNGNRHLSTDEMKEAVEAVTKQPNALSLKEASRNGWVDTISES